MVSYRLKLGGFAMARSPKPWFWKARRAWFVTIGGQRHDLGPTKAAAIVRFHELMADPPKRARAARGQMILAVIEAYLDWCQKHRSPDTYDWYRDRLERFAQRYPTLTTSEIRPYHVQEWIDGMEGISSGTKRNYCRSIKRAMRWAKRLGYIDDNPIADMEQPKAGKRETVISQEEFDAILQRVPDRYFRDLLITTWETGCRPQESLRVEGRHVDLTHSRWVFPESEAKGGIPRIVYLTDRSAEITRRLMLQNPEGKLFCNSVGKAWTTESVNCAFTRLQVKTGAEVVKQRGENVPEREIRAFAKTLAPTRTVRGVTVKKDERACYLEARTKLRYRLSCRFAPKYSLYVLRHSWATHALERGMDSVTVAVLMGHRDPSTLARVYQHLTHNPTYLREQAKRAVS
jgi:integrase